MTAMRFYVRPSTAVVPILVLAALFAAAMNLVGCQNADPAARRQAAINTYAHAVVLYQNGDSDQAIAALQDSVKQHHDLIMPHAMLGDLYQARQDYTDALAEFQEVVRLDPYGYENHYKLGLVYQILKRLPDAIASYFAALHLNADDFNTNMNLGAAFLAMGKSETALPYTQRATELNAKSAPAFANLGVVCDSLKMWKDAETAYRKALELDSNQMQTAFCLAENLMHQGHYADARGVMGQIVLREDSAVARKRFGDAMFMSQQYDDARLQYENALKLDPKYYPAMNQEGWLLITQYIQGLGLDDARRQAAIQLWKRSLQIEPDQSRIIELVHKYEQKFAN